MNSKIFDSIEIENYHRKLNSVSNSPQYAYRRNARVYDLVCYVNNIIGCFLSHNERPIPVFINRARKHMTEFPKNEELTEYYDLVTNYLNEVEKHLHFHGVDTT